MHCKHCFYLIDESYDVCPNCGKPLKDEPVQESSDAIELPMKKDQIELSAEDQFTASFIQKDDPLANVKEIAEKATKASTGLIVSRIACVLAVLFFAGVLYYTKVVLPKINEELAAAAKEEGETDPDIYGTTTPIKNTKLTAELNTAFSDETINSQLKKNDINYSKDNNEVDLKIKYGTDLDGTSFDVLIKRSYSSGVYDDSITFKYGDNTVSGVLRTYTSLNEDLVNDVLNSYAINKVNNLAVMYTKASTFQLSNPTTILLFRNGYYNKVEKVVTTYSTDGVSIVQCPITITNDGLSYCYIKDSFEKGKDVQIYKANRNVEGQETVVETITGLVAK